ncbi:hypothetical protein L0F63_004893 [Massospora cicadina]|nr:hypothetical protein L0F63_004893 [Massospora cicadina]
MLLELKRNGLNLQEQQRAELKTIYTKLLEFSIQFTRTITNDETSVKLLAEELKGMPKKYLLGLKSRLSPLLEIYAVSVTRGKVQFAYGTRCMSNIAVLEEDIALCSKVAQLIGYWMYANYMLKIKMAQLPKKVTETPQGDQIERTPGSGHVEEVELDSTRIELWDLGYAKAHFKVDCDKVNQYFPLDHATIKVLDIYQDILNLTLSGIWDCETLELLGYFYLDLFPQMGKYPHTTCFPLQPG